MSAGLAFASIGVETTGLGLKSVIGVSGFSGMRGRTSGPFAPGPIQKNTSSNISFVGSFVRSLDHVLKTELNAMDCMSLVFAYLSPETVLPVTSLLATVAGVVMMFGRTIFRPVLRWVRFARIRRRVHAVQTPHRQPGPRVERCVLETSGARSSGH